MRDDPLHERRGTRFDGLDVGELALDWKAPLVETYARIGSTNDRAAELARGGTPRGSVVLADEQTAGRGRRGARWRSAADAGVWMSIVLDERDALRQLPLIVGVACAEAIEEACPGLGVRVKWPNDLLVRGRKLGGILVERIGDRVVVGIGVNVRAPADGFGEDLRGVATSLEAEVSRPPGRARLVGAIVGSVLARLDRTDPVGDAIEALSARDALLGTQVETEQAGAGVAVGIDSTGALWLERPDGTRVSVVAGSVRRTEPPS